MKRILVASLPAHLFDALWQACANMNQPMPEVLLIDDGTPDPDPEAQLRAIADRMVIPPAPTIDPRANPEPFYRNLPKYRRCYR